MKNKLLFIILGLIISQTTWAQESFYVATDGNDSNAGTLAAPFATIERARDEVRLHNASMTDDITVYIRGGKYYHNAPIELDERDSGKNGHDVIYKGYNGEMPEIFGGQPVTGWSLYEGSIYRTFVGIGTKFYNLSENEDGALEARSDYFHIRTDATVAGSGLINNTIERSKDLAYYESDIPDSYDLSQAAIHGWCGIAHWNWDPRVAPVESVDRNNHVMRCRFDLSNGDTWTVFMKDARYYVRGVYEFLDEPGEFFMNKNDGYLYYWPRNFPIQDQEIVRPTTDMIFKIMGSELNTVVSNITLEGLKLQLTESTHYNNRSDFMEKAEGQLRDSRGISPGRQGIVYVENAEEIKVRYCKILSPGIHGIALSFKALNCEVYGNWIKDVGNQAISACGYTPDLHPFHYDPQYGPGTTEAQAPSNLKFSSWQEGNVNGGHNLSNNRIQNLGLLTGNSTGIKMYISSDNTVTNNDISNGPRHGISHSGPMWEYLDGGFDPIVMEKDGKVWGTTVTSGNAGQFRSRNNVVMFNNLYQLVKDSNDVGPIHYYGTGWDPTQIANFDSNGDDDAYVDADGNPTGASVGKYRNNVCVHNVMHDFYGMDDAGLFFGVQNDDDSSYCVELYNMVYNWGAPNANNIAMGNNGSHHLSRFSIINSKKTNMNLPVDSSTNHINCANGPVISAATAEAMAKEKGINWDKVGVQSDHPWPPTGLLSLRLTADTTFGSLPLPVTFDASGHTSNDPEPIFSWDFDGDGTVDLTGTNAVVQHTYTIKGAFNAKVTLSDNTGSTVTSSLKITAGSTLSRSPVVRYQFDETSGSTVQDSSGNNNHGTLSGTPTWLPSGGEMDGALDCNGSVSIAVPSQVFDTVLDGFTIAFWTKSNGRSFSDNTLFHGTDSGGNKVFELLTDTTAGNFLEYYAGYDSNTTPTTDRVLFNALNDVATTVDDLLNDGDQWIHWAFRKNATGAMDIFRNGQFLVDNTRDASNQGPRVNLIQDVQNFVIGSQLNSTAKFNGIIDDFRIYDVMLSASEILSAMLPEAPPSAPTDIVNDASDIVSSLAADETVVTTFSVVDPNTSDAHTWELLDDAGGRFSVDANSGVLKIANASYIHVAMSTSHDITLRATDNTGLSFTKTFTLQVQNGSSVSPYSSPLDISNCVMWLDANDIDGDGIAEGTSESGLSSGEVTTWKDKSPSGNDASPADSSKQPQLIANAQAGKSVVRMDGIDDYVLFSPITTGQTIFWVLKDDALGDTLNRSLIGYIGANIYQMVRGERSVWHPSYATDWIKNGSTHINGGLVDGTATDLPSGYNIVSLLGDPNETPIAINALSTDRGLANRYWKGDMNELIIFDRTLSDTERQRMTSYLDSKWINPALGNFPPDSLTLSGTAVSSNAVNNDVIGAVTATDPNSGDTLSYTLTNDAGGRFKLIGTSLQVANASALSIGAVYDITLQVTDNGSLFLSRTFELTVGGTAIPNIAPTAAMSATPTSGTAPLIVSFDGSGSSDSDGTIASYAWDFDNNGSTDSTEVAPSNTYTSAGTYTAKLTVTDNEGKSASTTTTITVSSGANSAPTAAISATPTSGTAPLIVSFDGSGSSDSDGTIASYAWDFDNNGSTDSTEIAPSHTYTSAGTYTAKLTVTDDQGMNASTTTSITVSSAANSAPTAAISATPTSGTAPLIVSFDGSGSSDSDGTIASYAWDFDNNGSTDSTEVAPSNTYTSAGTYTAKLTVTDDQGMSASTTTTITVSTAPAEGTETLELSSGNDFLTIVGDNSTGSPTQYGSIVNTSGGDLIWDIGETLTLELDLSVTDPEYVSYTMGWGIGIGDDTAALGFGARYESGTTLRYNAGTDSSAAGPGNFGIDLNSTSDRETLVVLDGTDADLRNTGELAHFTFEATRNAVSNYSMTVTWHNAAQTVSESHSVVTTNAAIESFTELLFRVNTLNLSTTDSYELTTIRMSVDSVTNAAPSAVISATPTSGTAPLIVSFDGSGSSDSDGTIASYAWDFDNNGSTDSTEVAPSHTYTSAGTYTAKLTVTDNGGKSDSSTTEIIASSAATTYTITASAGSNGSISPSGAVTVTEGQNQTFTISPNPGYEVADVLVNGSSIGTETSYSFNNVVTNHTISCSFQAIPIPPVSLPDGIIFWVDANDIDGDGVAEGMSEAGVESDGTVSAWADKSTNSNHATQAEAARRPKLLTSALNGNPTLEFDGADDFMSFASVTNIYTVFWVIKDTETNLSTTARSLLGHSSTFNFVRGAGDSLWNPAHTAANIRNGTTRLNGSIISGIVAGQNLDTDVWSTVSVVTSGGPVEANQITRDRNFEDRNWKGEIAEIIIYNTALSDADREEVESYLNTKWFVPPSSNTFAAWASTEGVSGVAEADYDNDGISDFVEYALGMEPKISDASLPVSFTLQASSDALYSFAKPIPDVTYTVQYTTNLTSVWQDYTGPETDSGTEISVTVPSSYGSEGNLYIRLRLTQ